MLRLTTDPPIHFTDTRPSKWLCVELFGAEGAYRAVPSRAFVVDLDVLDGAHLAHRAGTGPTPTPTSRSPADILKRLAKERPRKLVFR